MNQDSVKQYLEDIIETMSEGLFIVSPEGTITMVNKALEELTGYKRRELLGKPCTILNCDVCRCAKEQACNHWCKLFELKEGNRKQCRLVKKDGSYVEVQKNATVLRDGGKPIAAVEIVTDLSAIAERDQRINDLTRLFKSGFHGLVGETPDMRRLFNIIQRAALSDAPVIIHGESGTGKELAANAIHTLGARADKPFVQLNCAALNESLLESELFGHVRGAFTGAVRHRIGRFEAAHGGDIFLDEIGDVPMSIQVKLLRVLENKQLERVGDHAPINVDVRIITATNANLEELVAQGKFRRDFFYRINVIPIHIPPLRHRPEDIPLLADHFLELLGKKASLTPEAMRALINYDWPGNVRELKSAMEYACVLTDDGPITPDHLPPSITGAGNSACPEPQPHTPMDLQSPKQALVEALRRTGGNQSQAARLLGVSRGTISNRMKKYGIDLQKVITG